MKTSEINPTRWIDIVFENRHKAYGAYFIREEYSRHVATAMLITLLSLGFVLAYPRLAEYFDGDQRSEDVVLKSIKYTDLASPPPIDKDTPPPEKLDVPPPVKTTIKFLPPKVTEQEQEEEMMPTMEDVKQNEVGAENIEATGAITFEEPVAEVLKETNSDDTIFMVVEQAAEYSGGLEAMARFLQKNVKYPAVARRMGVEGSVYVSFVIERDGVISNIVILKGISAECDKEAARVIKMMPPWKPGKQNGKAVRCRFVLPVKFMLAV